MTRIAAALAVMIAAATPLAAKDSLGVFSGWAAFRDANVPRCYAIAAAEPARDGTASSGYATVGHWPKRSIRGQVHLRLSQPLRAKQANLRIGRQSFSLTVDGNKAWARDKAMDAAIIAAMRSAPSMRITAIGTNGRRFTDTYELAGAATAIDAATLGCRRFR